MIEKTEETVDSNQMKIDSVVEDDENSGPNKIKFQIKIDNESDAKNDKRNCSSDKLSEEKWLKYGDFTLTMFDKGVIESDKEWLTDTIINAAQHILQAQFPQIKGLQNVLLNEIQEFVAIDRGLRFVQIINDGGDHWIVLSNVKVDNIETDVKIYDSKCLSETIYSSGTKDALLKLMANSDKIIVDVEYVSQQEDTNQCGLYAVAFAHALCAGEDPSTILFSNSALLLRAHLLRCLQSGEITRFPTGYHTIVDSYII